MTFTLSNFAVDSLTAEQGSNVLAPRPVQLLTNPGFTDNGSYLPWFYRGAAVNLVQYPYSTSPGSFTNGLPSAGGGTLISQPIPFVQVGQTYTLTAKIVWNVWSSKGIGACTGTIDAGARLVSERFEAPFGHRETDINLSGILPSNGASFIWTTSCLDSNSGTTWNATLTISNLSFRVNA
jgi:hypothetical protein